MAGRATYGDADQARVYVALQANDGNVKRTARETGVPESTVRRWREEWERGGPPPADALELAVDDFYVQAEAVRFEALAMLRMKIPDAKPGELITIIGVLDDKLARVKGLGTKTEHKITLPSAEELRALMSGFVAGAITAAERRHEEIVDAEIVEQPRKGLPAPRP